jgi:hypothetical protein
VTLPLPGGPLPDPAVQAKFDEISLKWPANTQQQSVQAASTQVDFLVPSTAKFAVIEYALELTSFASDLRMAPNALGTNIYGDIRDGSYETSAPAAVAIAAVGNGVLHNNGLRLAFPIALAAAGGISLSGRATFMLRVPALGGQRRSCMAQVAQSSTTGSNNHLIELQNIASVMQSGAAITSLRFLCSAGTMSGLITVTTS